MLIFSIVQKIVSTHAINTFHSLFSEALNTGPDHKKGSHWMKKRPVVDFKYIQITGKNTCTFSRLIRHDLLSGTEKNSYVRMCMKSWSQKENGIFLKFV